MSIPELTLTDEEIKNIGKIHIVACGGDAWHVGMTAKYIFEDMARIPCETDASEFRYRDPIIKKGDICIVINNPVKLPIP